MDEAKIKTLLAGFRAGKISLNKVMNKLKDLPYTDLGFARVDGHRTLRKGFPEVVYCQGKTHSQIEAIADNILKEEDTLLLTRATEEIYRRLVAKYPALCYNEAAKVIYLKKHPSSGNPPRQGKGKGLVLIITGGTGDIPVAEEAAITLEVMGNRIDKLYDVGVAGIHRLLDKNELLKKSSVIIVVAGMEGALASVVGGLVSKPVIAVPTSIGYGASFQGLAALLTMLNSCAPGVAVVNIDNGFGAGYFASLINR